MSSNREICSVWDGLSAAHHLPIDFRHVLVVSAFVSLDLVFLLSWHFLKSVKEANFAGVVTFVIILELDWSVNWVPEWCIADVHCMWFN